MQCCRLCRNRKEGTALKSVAVQELLFFALIAKPRDIQFLPVEHP